MLACRQLSWPPPATPRPHLQLAGPRHHLGAQPARHPLLHLLGHQARVSGLPARFELALKLCGLFCMAPCNTRRRGHHVLLPLLPPTPHHPTHQPPLPSLPTSPHRFWVEFVAWEGKVNNLAGIIGWFFVLVLWVTSLETVRRRMYQVRARAGGRAGGWAGKRARSRHGRALAYRQSELQQGAPSLSIHRQPQAASHTPPHPRPPPHHPCRSCSSAATSSASWASSSSPAPTTHRATPTLFPVSRLWPVGGWDSAGAWLGSRGSVMACQGGQHSTVAVPRQLLPLCLPSPNSTLGA